jgi:linoleoyl-CoA desaturase
MQERIEYNVGDNPAFYTTLQKRIRSYFKESGKKPTADGRFYIKALAMGALYWLPLVAIILFEMPLWLFFGLWILIGLGMAGIGMNVMHDANHGSVSEKGWINKLMGASMYLLAGNVFTWKVQHNVLHHNYTNVHGVDEDIETDGLIKLHPESKTKRIHKYQHIYAPFLYGLLTINWLIAKDFKQWKRYYEMGLGKPENKRRDLFSIIIWKLVLFLPVLNSSGICWWLQLCGCYTRYCNRAFCCRFHVECHLSTGTHHA